LRLKAGCQILRKAGAFISVNQCITPSVTDPPFIPHSSPLLPPDYSPVRFYSARMPVFFNSRPRVSWSDSRLILFAVPRGLPGGCLGVGWGLPGGSEGFIPRNPQATPSKPPRKSLYRENEWRRKG